MIPEYAEKFIPKLLEGIQNLQVFEGIAQAYLRTRRNGHTSLMIEALALYVSTETAINKSHKPTFVCANTGQLRNVKDQMTEKGWTEIIPHINFMTVEEFRDAKFMGQVFQGPIVWDNFAVLRLADEGNKVQQSLRNFERLLGENNGE